MLRKLFYIFLPIVLGSIIGFITKNSIDYNTLVKPPLSPPSIIFPIMWSILYILMGISYYIYRKYNDNKILYYAQLFVNLLWSIIFIAVCLVNAVYFKNYLSFASFSLLSTATGELGGYTDAVFENILTANDFIFLWQLFALTFVHIQLRKKKYYDEVEQIEIRRVRFLNMAVVILILLGFFLSMLTGLDISRLKKQWNREYIVQEFGIYTYQANDLVSYIRTKVNSMFGYDEAAKRFREFYAETEESKSNKYTNIFNGKNVIVIHAESIQNFLISDDNKGGAPTKFNGVEVTPNLNKIAKEGMYFSNFYSEEGAGTSSDTEFTFATSLLPSNSGTVFINYYDRDYVTIQKLFNELGYNTSSMHANMASAWNRNRVHPSLGYQDMYFYKDAYEIDETIQLGLSDSSFFRQSIEHIKKINEEHDKWYTLLIMLTNHTPFSDINRWEEENNKVYDVTYKYEETNPNTGKKVTKSAPYMDDTKLGNYFKSAHYADNAIGEFIDGLDEAGLLENTVIVIYGDHDNKLPRSEYNRFYNYDYKTDKIKEKDDPTYINVDDYFYELNRSVPFIIWTKDMKGTKYNKEITKVMGMVDVQPTLGNMFGFKNKYALGHDIFSVTDNCVVFPSGNWLTDKIYYNSARGESYQLDLSSGISMDYINQYQEYAEKRIQISNDIITYDLIRRVGENPDNKLIEEVGVSSEQTKKK